MTPTDFPESNVHFGPPEDMTESQVKIIPAFVGIAATGSCDGSQLVVVAWKPSVSEITELCLGGTIYLTMLGGLSPHFLTTSFEAATTPA